jgi:sRNA-binding protein
MIEDVIMREIHGRGGLAGTPGYTLPRGLGNRIARALCSLTTKWAAGMASQYRIERDRGTKESAQQFAGLREKWPLAFPVKHRDIRPLAIGATGEIAATMGWSHPYTLGVLHAWKMAPVYCQAVLCHDQRIALDGAPAEAVDAEAKDLATKRLAEIAARKAAKKAAKTSAPAVVKSDPAPAPPIETLPETPEQLRARVRASLLRRSA